jgi:hypothetical protein
VVSGVIKKYGFYIEDPVYYGFLRGDMIDFDNYGMPELVCIYQKRGTVQDRQSVSIYRYKNDAAELLIDKQTGNGIFLGGEPCVEFAYIDGKTYIITEDSVRGKTENLYIYTVENGMLKTINISADFTLKKDEDYTVNHYLNCTIDGKSVSEEEYRAQRDYYRKDALKWLYVDASKRSSYSKGYEALCIKNLAKNAGISESEVSELLTSTTTEAKTPKS